MVDYNYSGRIGHYWDKSSCITTTRGQYLLDNAYDCVFGEPAVLAGTGTKSTPIMKKYVHSYKGTAGDSGCIGVFTEWRKNIDDKDDEWFAVNGVQDKKRDITIVRKGPVTVENVGSSNILDGDTVIPADGGCEVMTATGQRALGKAMQDIGTGEIGLVWIDPDYDKAIANGAIL